MYFPFQRNDNYCRNLRPRTTLAASVGTSLEYFEDDDFFPFMDDQSEDFDSEQQNKILKTEKPKSTSISSQGNLKNNQTIIEKQSASIPSEKSQEPVYEKPTEETISTLEETTANKTQEDNSIPSTAIETLTYISEPTSGVSTRQRNSAEVIVFNIHLIHAYLH